MNEIEFGKQADPAADSIRELFEGLAFYVIVWSLAVGAGAGSLWAVATFAPEQPGGWTFIAALLICVASAAVILAKFDGAKGRVRHEWARRLSRRFAFPVTLTVGLLAGWAWRHYNPPDPIRTQAERAGWMACSQVPTCVALAERASGISGIHYYIDPPPPKKAL